MNASPAELRNRLKLRQLTLLAALNATGSLHKAAERCGMSQPAATRLIHELEGLVGAELFERTSRGMVPTDMGRLLTRHASMLLAGIDHVHHEAAALKAGNAGNLRLGLSPGTSPRLVAQAIAMVKESTPRMDIQIVDGANDFLVAGLRDGSLNLAVGRAPAASTNIIDFELLFMEHFSVVCGANNPLADSGAGLSELIDQPWILPVPETALRTNLDLQFLSQCGRLPQDVIESASVPTNIALVESTGRFAVMPGSRAGDRGHTGQIRIVIDRLPDLQGPIGILTRRDEVQPSHVLRMIDAFREASRDHVKAQRA